MRFIKVVAGIGKTQLAMAAKIERQLVKAGFKLDQDKAELIIVVGGDGTLLHYMRELGYPGTPFLGIDGGSLGYFQELSPQDIKLLPSLLKSGSYHLQKLPLLELRSDNDKKIFAFNEFAIERASARAAHISLTLDNYKFEKFIGDGLIVSSPQGSTAYAGAAGGAIIPYDIKVFQVVPSNPHQSSLYKSLRQPLVLGPQAKLDINVLSARERPVRVVADGQSIDTPSHFEIRLSRRNITMLRTHQFDFYKRLSQKLIG